MDGSNVGQQQKIYNRKSTIDNFGWTIVDDVAQDGGDEDMGVKLR